MTEGVIATLYLLITFLFSMNLNGLYGKFKNGNDKITIYSLLATISLIVMFLGLSLYFWFKIPEIIIVAQVYLLTTMLFIKFKSK